MEDLEAKLIVRTVDEQRDGNRKRDEEQREPAAKLSFRQIPGAQSGHGRQPTTRR